LRGLGSPGWRMYPISTIRKRSCHRPGLVSIRALAWLSDKVYQDSGFAAPASIRTPVSGATRHRGDRARCRSVSDPRSAWRATFPLRKPHRVGVVSIRAPAWGAASFIRSGIHVARVSIRAPACGSDWQAALMTIGIAEFRSTPPRGERQAPITCSSVMKKTRPASNSHGLCQRQSMPRSCGSI
jgi:hypothetical protein